jgi:DNA topoisomerase IA
MHPGSEQKEQLERMLEEQQTVKAKEAEAKSAAAAPPSRVSRARMPKPIVK